MPDTGTDSKQESSPLKRLIVRFLRISIAKKMLLGYLAFALVILLIALFTLSSLERLNTINRSVISTDMPLIEAADRMIDVLFSQELYARRSAILKSPEVLALFWERSGEFDRLVGETLALPDLGNVPADRLSPLHSEYNDLMIKWLQAHQGRSPSAKEYDSDVRRKQEELINLIKHISATGRHRQSDKVLSITDIGTRAFRITAALCFVGLAGGIAATILFTRSIAGPIERLKVATQEIAEGRFDVAPEIKNRDELGDLARAFQEMAGRLKELEERCLDASPLTRLPGSTAIETVLDRRLRSGKPLAFCLIDMDNFKAFNDRYGYARGSEVIKATGKIIEKAVAEYGGSDIFFGHIGGDDFVVITTPDRYHDICRAVITGFDGMIAGFYDAEDREKGYIEAKTRQGQEASFPIMTVSIAVVTNRQTELTSPLQVGEIAAELKEYAKGLRGSVCIVDRRRQEYPA